MVIKLKANFFFFVWVSIILFIDFPLCLTECKSSIVFGKINHKCSNLYSWPIAWFSKKWRLSGIINDKVIWRKEYFSRAPKVRKGKEREIVSYWPALEGADRIILQRRLALPSPFFPSLRLLKWAQPWKGSSSMKWRHKHPCEVCGRKEWAGLGYSAPFTPRGSEEQDKECCTPTA